MPRDKTVISFVCTGCGKRLQVKPELAGKPVRCRACGQANIVLAQPVDASEDMETLPPRERHELTQAGAGQVKPVTSVQATQSLPAEQWQISFTGFLSPPQAPDELGRLGNYRILSVLGHGGMGVVFKAQDTKLKRTVAIKAMLGGMAASASAGQRFLREAQAMAAVKHDHVVTIYQVDEERGIPFLAMEFLHGETLDERLKRGEQKNPASRALPLTEVLSIGREVAEGLAAAHATGLVHRDIKPANIWLESVAGGQCPVTSITHQLPVAGRRPLATERVKILDFGLAKAVSRESGLTQQGAIIGTPAYMAPEQAHGSDVDFRTDLFSLGVVLYRLCSGELPFKGKDSVSTLVEVASQNPLPPARLNRQVPPELSDLIMSLLEKDPATRLGSAAEVARRLAEIERSFSREPTASAAARRDDAKRKRAGESALAGGSRLNRRWLAVGIAAAMVLLGGIITAAVVLLRTGDGDYVIETDDPDFFFQVNKKGGVTLEDRKTKHTYQLKVLKHDKNEYELEVTDPDADLVFQTKTFTIRRGQQVALKASFKPRDEGSGSGESADDWVTEIAAMPADKQVKAVMAKMKDLNSGFDGEETHVCGKAGVVTELHFVSDNVTDISPIRALTGLQILECGGSDIGKGRLADLTPLTGLKLTELHAYSTRVSDLSPLKGMKLTVLNCDDTSVADLSPLTDMPLTQLFVRNSRVKDLAPIKNMKLTMLNISSTEVADFTPLNDMPLTKLWCVETTFKDLGVLAGMPLEVLECHHTEVADLTPLKGMPLTELQCHDTKVTDLSPLEGMKLTLLWFGRTGVEDLSPLKGMPLTSLGCEGTKITDLAPLAGMKLTLLHCGDTAVTDISVLKGMPVEELEFDVKRKRDGPVLRTIKTLKTINGEPPEKVLGNK